MKRCLWFYTGLKDKWGKLSLKWKSFITLILGVMIPTFATAMILLNSLNLSETQKIRESSQRTLEITAIEVSNNTQLAQTSIQLIKSYRVIAEFLSRKDLSAKDIYEFNRIYTRNIESILTSNPKLNSIRIYYDNAQVPEMWPIFYSNDRIKNEPWYEALSYNSTYILYNYDENIANYSGYVPQKGLLSFFTKMQIDQNNDVMIEVSMKMKDFFAQLYSVSKTGISVFFENGNLYYDVEDEAALLWTDVLAYIKQNIHFLDREKDMDIITLHHETYLISFQKEKFLDGYMLQITSLTKSLENIQKTWNSLILSIVVIVFLSCIIVNRVISIALKRLYKVIDAMREVERGNWEIEIPHTDGDELSRLAYYFNKMARQITILMEQNTKRAIMEKDAQIRALQNQINSHFLYNTLESIKMMAELADQPSISEAITALAKLLRYSMSWKSQNTKIAREVEYVQNYLKIINLRYDYVITLSTQLIPELCELEIPKMTIQPIVENAVIHSIDKMQSDATIYIKMAFQNDQVIIAITDNGTGMTEEEVLLLNERIKGNIPAPNGSTTGIGLRNVQERLELLFGKESGIHVISDKGKFTKVVVVIPLWKTY